MKSIFLWNDWSGVNPKLYSFVEFLLWLRRAMNDSLIKISGNWKKHCLDNTAVDVRYSTSECFQNVLTDTTTCSWTLLWFVVILHDGFISFKQPIIYYIQLTLLNAKHELWSINIWLCFWYSRIVGLSLNFLCFEL